MTAAHDLAILRTTSLPASDGSSLVGFLQSGTSATARTVQAKLRDVVSVKDFGAVGDGVTDDTAAIIAANAAAAGRSLYFPAGTYKWAGSITPGSTTSGQKSIWFGDGWLTKLSAIDSTATILITNQCTIRDMAIWGSNATPGAYVGTGVQIGNTSFVGYVDLIRLRIRYFQTGIRFAAALWTTINKSVIEFNRTGCDFNAGGASLYSTTVFFQESVISDSERGGIDSSYVPHTNLAINFIGCTIQNNNTVSPGSYPQVALPNCYNVSMLSGYFENTNATLNVDAANINGFVFQGNFVEGGTIGVQATSAALRNAVISGNYFSGLSGTKSINVTGGNNVKAFGNQISYLSTNTVTGTNCTDADTYPLTVSKTVEGTFSPTIQGTTTAGTNTYGTQTGYYNQIGNIVFFRGRLSMSVKDAAMAGNVQINLVGLPNSAIANQAYSLVQITPNSGVTFSGTYSSLVGEISSGGVNLVDIQQVGPSGETQLPVTGIAAGLTFRFSGFYVVA